MRLNAPIATMGATRNGRGYWLLGRDGGVFTFGTARFHGSAVGSMSLAVGLVSSRSGRGYWIVSSSDTIQPFGDAPALTAPATASPVVGIATRWASSSGLAVPVCSRTPPWPLRDSSYGRDLVRSRSRSTTVRAPTRPASSPRSFDAACPRRSSSSGTQAATVPSVLRAEVERRDVRGGPRVGSRRPDPTEPRRYQERTATHCRRDPSRNRTTTDVFPAAVRSDEQHRDRRGLADRPQPSVVERRPIRLQATRCRDHHRTRRSRPRTDRDLSSASTTVAETAAKPSQPSPPSSTDSDHAATPSSACAREVVVQHKNFSLPNLG